MTYLPPSLSLSFNKCEVCCILGPAEFCEQNCFFFFSPYLVSALFDLSFSLCFGSVLFLFIYLFNRGLETETAESTRHLFFFFAFKVAIKFCTTQLLFFALLVTHAVFVDPFTCIHTRIDTHIHTHTIIENDFCLIQSSYVSGSFEQHGGLAAVGIGEWVYRRQQE